MRVNWNDIILTSTYLKKFYRSYAFKMPNKTGFKVYDENNLIEKVVIQNKFLLRFTHTEYRERTGKYSVGRPPVVGPTILDNM